MNQVVKVCAGGLAGGATVCVTAPAWVVVASVAIVTGAVVIVMKSQQESCSDAKLAGRLVSR